MNCFVNTSLRSFFRIPHKIFLNPPRLQLIAILFILLTNLSTLAEEPFFHNRQKELSSINTSRKLVLPGCRDTMIAPERTDILPNTAIVFMPRISVKNKEINRLLNAYNPGMKVLNNIGSYHSSATGLLDLLWDRYFMLNTPASEVFLELAAGDINTDPVAIERGLYGIFGRQRQRKIYFIYMFDRSFLYDEVKMKKYNKIVEIYEKVAGLYHISSFNFGAFLLKEIACGRLTREQLYTGDKLSDISINLLVSEFHKMGCTAAENNRIGIMDSNWNMQLSFYEGIVKLDRSGWLDWQYCPIQLWQHLLVCTTPQKIAEVSFVGDTVGIEILYVENNRDFEYQIDDLPWITYHIPQLSGPRNFPIKLLLANGLDEKKNHSLKIRLPNSEEKNELHIGNYFVRGKFIPVAKFMEEKNPVKQADLIYQEMPKIEFCVKKNDFAPKTYQKLLRHEPISIVMLGDSIVNDIYGSNFLNLLERYYNTPIRKIASVTGGGGCGRYKEDKILYDMVIKHKPDLLFIGGISDNNPKNTECVIQKVRKRLPDTEIVILSPIYGPHNPLKNPSLLQCADLQKESYHTEKMRMAAQNNVPYLDISQPLYQYIMDNIHDVPFQVYKRDAVHASKRGRQAAGRVLYHIFVSNYPASSSPQSHGTNQ